VQKQDLYRLLIALRLVFRNRSKQTLDLLPCLSRSFERHVEQSDVTGNNERKNNIERKRFASERGDCAFRWRIESDVILRNNKHLSTYIGCVLSEDVFKSRNESVIFVEKRKHAWEQCDRVQPRVNKLSVHCERTLKNGDLRCNSVNVFTESFSHKPNISL